MKIILFICLTGYAYCQNVLVSSYSSLPYELESQNYIENSVDGGYDAQMYEYRYPYRGRNKFNLNFGKIVTAPFKAMKGAGNYVTGVLSDIKGKYLQLKGSIARSKANWLNGYGDNLLRKAYNLRTKYYKAPEPEYTYVQPYYTYDVPAPSYPEPKPVYGAPSKKSTIDFSNTNGFGTPKASDIIAYSDNTIKTSNAIQVQNSKYPPLKPSRPVVNYRADREIDFPDLNVAESEARISVDYPDNGRPIPVPVPIKISPMKLVFPNLPH